LAVDHLPALTAVIKSSTLPWLNSAGEKYNFNKCFKELHATISFPELSVMALIFVIKPKISFWSTKTNQKRLRTG
jgi:hypothetical protein